MKRQLSDISEKIIFAVAILLTATGLAWTFKDGVHWIDFNGQWSLCAYTLRGVNPFTIIGERTPLIPEIGTVTIGFGTTPWGLILGQLFYPGFLSESIARLYFAALYIVVAIAMTMLIYRQYGAQLKANKATGCLLCLLSLSYWFSFDQGNAGGLFCAAALISVLLADKNFVVSGVCIAFAMIKPQVALLVCIAMLIYGKLKPLIVGAVIDVIAWIVAAIVTHTSVFDLLSAVFNSGIGGPEQDQYVGIFTVLIDSFPEAFTVNGCMYMSMLFGLILTVVMTLCIKRLTSEVMFVMAPAFAITSFWSYSWNNDKFILFVPVLAFLLLYAKEKSNIKYLWIIIAFAFAFEKYVLNVLKRLFIVFPINADYDWHYARSLYAIIMLVAGAFAICHFWKKKRTESRKG